MGQYEAAELSLDDIDTSILEDTRGDADGDDAEAWGRDQASANTDIEQIALTMIESSWEDGIDPSPATTHRGHVFELSAHRFTTGVGRSARGERHGHAVSRRQRGIADSRPHDRPGFHGSEPYLTVLDAAVRSGVGAP